jgi:Fic family protein
MNISCASPARSAWKDDGGAVAQRDANMGAMGGGGRELAQGRISGCHSDEFLILTGKKVVINRKSAMLYTAGKLPSEYREVVERIDLLRNRLRYALQGHPRRWTGLLRRATFARAVQGSNSIEGYNVAFEDAVAAIEGEEPMDTHKETWRAISGYRSAMSYILQLADDPFYSHNEGTIRSLHYMMVGFDLTKHPGRWRPGSIFVRNEPSGEIVYEGPDVSAVPDLMAEFIASLNEPSEMPVTVRAAMAHLNLVMIHPFSDGNGRMGRALQTMVLSREGILDSRFSSIEEYLGRNTLDYYKILAEVGRGAWHPEHDALPWIRFCLTAHYRQAQTLLRRHTEMNRLVDVLVPEVKRLGLQDRVIYALLEAGFGHRIRNSTYRAIAEITDEVASKDLRALVAHELLVPEGERRGRVYAAGEWLRKARVQTRETRSVTDPFDQSARGLSDPRQSNLPGLGVALP